MMSFLKVLGLVVGVMVVSGCIHLPPSNFAQPDCSTQSPNKHYTIYVEPHHVHDNIGVTMHDWDRDVYLKEAISKRLKVTFVDSPDNAQIIIKTIKSSLGGGSSLHMQAVTLINGQEITTKVVMPDNFLGWRNGKKDSIVYGKADAELFTTMFICTLNGFKVSKGEARIKATNHVYENIGNIEIE